MKMQVRFSVPVALACILLAKGAQPRSSRAGPAEIYPDSAMTPGAANTDVTQHNI